jgi:hypothetical protein
MTAIALMGNSYGGFVKEAYSYQGYEERQFPVLL